MGFCSFSGAGQLDVFLSFLWTKWWGNHNIFTGCSIQFFITVSLLVGFLLLLCSV